MNTFLTIRLLLGFVPVSLFLSSLVYLDSYKLVKLRTILQLIGAGAIAAALSYLVNRSIFSIPGISHRALTIFAAPLVEEILKATPLLVLIRTKRVGFLVDAAIFGFALGTGFALLENVYYFWALPNSSAPLWIVRGFGTAIMHGGSTAIVGMMAKTFSDSTKSRRKWFALPGLLAAYLFHALFNSFLLPPLISATILIVAFPPLLMIVFGQSERYLRAWLGGGFDVDSELIALIQSGEFADSPVGRYLASLRQHFEGPVLADMLCLLRLNAELALRAKGILLMRESGFEVKRETEIDEKLAELRYLRKSIGRTGELAISPVLNTSAEDAWQLTMLETT